MQTSPQRIALYARVSAHEQTAENQILELRAFCAARGWTVAAEYVDTGVSTTSRPQLDDLLTAARRRKIDGIVTWKLDRLGRNVRHLILTLDELTALRVSFVSLGESIDTTTAAGRLQLHILGAFAEFERRRITERVHAGIARARQQGRRLGRRRSTPLPADAPKTGSAQLICAPPEPTPQDIRKLAQVQQRRGTMQPGVRKRASSRPSPHPLWEVRTPARCSLQP